MWTGARAAVPSPSYASAPDSMLTDAQEEAGSTRFGTPWPTPT
jgi:hypothetical protein